jgi:hypothetical protein
MTKETERLPTQPKISASPAIRGGPSYIEITGGSVELDDQNMALVASGLLSIPGFLGNVTYSQTGTNFSSGVSSSSSFGGISNIFRGRTGNTSSPLSTENSDYYLTDFEISELEKKAASIAASGTIPVDVIEDFLWILVSIDNIEDMTKIANAVEIDALIDESILRVPLAIFALTELEKIAFLANAVAAIIKAFSKYIGKDVSYADESSESSIFDAIVSNLGIASSLVSLGAAGSNIAVKAGSADQILGNFMSELVLGTRIPMCVQTQNPMLKAPSYVGKVFFGESPVSTSLIDIDQLFPKAIAVFSDAAGGAGTNSFEMQNFGSFGGTNTLSDMVNTIAFGTTSFAAGSYKESVSTTMVSNVSSLLNVSSDAGIELKRADNAIPFMEATTRALSGGTDAVFPAQVFQQGWIAASTASSLLSSETRRVLETLT